MKKILIIVVLLLFLGAAWYLASPLIIDKEINEDFPIPSDEVLAQMSNEELDAIRDDLMDAMANGPDEEMIEMMPYSSDIPLVVVEGVLRGADEFHQASGLATVYELADSSRFLRLEEFMITNGPDLRVFLSTDAEVRDGNYIELDKLKGNKGNQNYILPPDLDIGTYDTVVIYCKPFHVVFATADLKTF